MKKNGKKVLLAGIGLITAFLVWTVLVQKVDVQPVGPNGTNVGFASLNVWFHELTGVHMTIYAITDWMGLIPILVCVIFGVIGLVQLIRTRSLLKVDCDIILLGIYYVIVFFCYLIFEIITINYRPILIQGFLEASYPSSTTLLVLSVMPTLAFRAKRKLKKVAVQKVICTFVTVFSTWMVLGRLVAGVHWLTDIVGAVWLSGGLFYVFKAAVLLCCKEEK